MRVRALLPPRRSRRTIGIDGSLPSDHRPLKGAMLLAADLPFLEVLWTMIIFFAWLCWFWMVILLLSDVFGRRDIGGWAKAGWTVFFIVLPFIGVLTYVVAQHDGIAERRDRQRGAPQATAGDRAGSGTSSEGPAAEIANAKRLLDQGAIDANEFEQIKHRALAVR
jgi:hypothetical protein